MLINMLLSSTEAGDITSINKISRKVGAVTQDAYKLLSVVKKRTTNYFYIYTSTADIRVLIHGDLLTCSLILGFTDSSR